MCLLMLERTNLFSYFTNTHLWHHFDIHGAHCLLHIPTVEVPTDSFPLKAVIILFLTLFICSSIKGERLEPQVKREIIAQYLSLIHI